LKIVTMKVADLSADPANVRKHDEKNIEAIVGSLRRFGQQVPIVVDKSGTVRAGNARLEAARRLGWETIEAYVSNLTGSEMTAYAIADNRTSELADWDTASLAATLEALQYDDDDLLKVTGFTEDELAQLAIEAMAGLDLGDDDDDSNDDTGDAADPTITVSFPLTADQEIAFRHCVSLAKTKLHADSTGDAVIRIMEQWCGQVQ
jgi:ParB-like chromosome segregation protein Spo0J